MSERDKLIEGLETLAIRIEDGLLVAKPGGKTSKAMRQAAQMLREDGEEIDRLRKELDTAIEGWRLAGDVARKYQASHCFQAQENPQSLNPTLTETKEPKEGGLPPPRGMTLEEICHAYPDQVAVVLRRIQAENTKPEGHDPTGQEGRTHSEEDLKGEKK